MVKCCVPYCKTGYHSLRRRMKSDGGRMPSLFRLPKDSEELLKWTARIRRADRALTPKDWICEIHFQDHFIDRYFEHQMSHGELFKLERERPVLKKGAIPSIFPDFASNVRSANGGSPLQPNRNTKSSSGYSVAGKVSNVANNPDYVSSISSDKDRKRPPKKNIVDPSVITSPCAAWLDTLESLPSSDTLTKIVDKRRPAQRPKKRRQSDDSDPQSESTDTQVFDEEENRVEFLESELNEIEELRQRLADASSTISKLEMKVKSLNLEKAALRKECQTYQKHLKLANLKIKKLENQVKLQGADLEKFIKKIRKDANVKAQLKNAQLVIQKLEDQNKYSERDRKTDQQEKKENESKVTSKKYENQEMSRLVVEKAELSNSAPEIVLRFPIVSKDLFLFQHYTGLPDYDCFNLLLKWLTSDTSKTSFNWLSHRISLDDQLLLTLMKLKLNADHVDLAVRFQVSQSTSSSIFTSVATALHEILSTKLKMPSLRERETSTSGLKQVKNFRCVVDYTDVILAIVGHPAAYCGQSKRRKTYRGLIACSMDGLVRYVSQVFPNPVSDDVIFNECGIVDSFDVEDLILPDTQDVISPSIAANEVRLNRIHTKHAIGRMKRYKILESFPFGYRQHLSLIFQLVGYLINLNSPTHAKATLLCDPFNFS